MGNEPKFVGIEHQAASAVLNFNLNDQGASDDFSPKEAWIHFKHDKHSKNICSHKAK